MWTGMLRKKFEAKGQEVTGGWRNLHTDEVCNIPLQIHLFGQ